MKKNYLKFLPLVIIGLLFTNLCSAQVTWTTQSSVEPNNWESITFGNGLFVAVASSGNGNRIMTSPDGQTWTIRNSVADYSWRTVTYGNGKFVAISTGPQPNNVMTSTDGITWTGHNNALGSSHSSVVYGNVFGGRYVAVANDGSSGTSGKRAMYSSDGETWTEASSTPTDSNLPIVDPEWQSVAFGNGTFVAVGYPAGVNTNVANRVMVSGTGNFWSPRTASSAANWRSVAFGNGIFVAVASGEAGADIMTSADDGDTWTDRTSPNDLGWESITFGNGTFVAVAKDSGTGNRIMTSTDGINWTARTNPVDNNWQSVAYGNGIFAAVSNNGTAATRVMISEDESLSIDNFNVQTIQVYPNPASDVINIKLKKDQELEYVKLYNGLGQLVIETNDKTIDVGHLNAGLYHLEIITKSGRTTEKVIID